MACRIYRKHMRSAVQYFGTTSPTLRCFTTIRMKNAYAVPTLLRQSWIDSVSCCSKGFQTTPALDDTHRVNMPSLSPTMTEGTIVKWMKKEGDAITAGDVLCEIQTDKAVVFMEHDHDGILAKILIPGNTADVKVGTLIALTVDEGEDWKSVEVPADAEQTPAGPKSTESTSAASTSAAPPSGSHGSDRLIGPAVKNYLIKYGLESSPVSPTGPHGTVMKGDVLKHALANKIEPVAIGSSPPAPSSAAVTKASKPKSQTGAASYVDFEISNMRRTKAKRLFQSKFLLQSTIPHAYGTAKCNMKSLFTFQKSLRNAGVKVSINDLLIKCIGNALSLSPAIHCVWVGLKPKHQSEVDISVAFATPNGLITPIVTNVGKRDVISISKALSALAEKARDGMLQPHEFMGGNFSISNLRMFGIPCFSAIINPPQCAILAVGCTSIELGEDRKLKFVVNVKLSYNARAIMDDEAVKFLAVLQNEIENVNEISMGIYDIKSRIESTQNESSPSLIDSVSCWSRGFQTTPALDDTHRVNMPSLSPTMTEGTIVKWMKKEGDAITAGDVLCEIQTDKAVVFMEHDHDGILAKILIPGNTADVKVGTLIALTVDEGEDWKSVEVPADAEQTPAGPKSTESTSAASTSAAPPSGSHGSDRLIGPAVKNYLRKYGLESSQVSPTGPHGTVMKGDVLKHALANKIEPVAIGASPPAPSSAAVTKASKPKSQTGAASYVETEIPNMLTTKFIRWFTSISTIPHAYGTAQCNMKTLISFQKSLRNAGLKVSINDILMKCIGNALSLSPAIHLVWDGSKKLKQQGEVDISVAVATPNGLITRIVTNTANRDVISISIAMRDKEKKARDEKLPRFNFMGAEFCISTLGRSGLEEFSCTINSHKRVVLRVGCPKIELGEDGKPKFVVNVKLVYDAGIVMDEEAGKFLAILQNEIENVCELSMGVFRIQPRIKSMESEAE
ncbi:unnamed protein product [Orchesella dallaii]|uniref:Dihydrolipoamide acetyltransferase component of pyruvate dehydrogenase complex n=1 Tax=Orchesella dallaii TaxID=48710 RepID=A0ABP1PYM0_9HEXA